MRLWQLAGIEAGSWSRALALWLVLLAVTASGELGAETLRALLLDRAGSDALPPAFALEAVLKLTAIPAYFWLSRRFSNRQLMAVTIGLYAAVTALIALAPASLLSGWLVPAFALEAVAQNLLVLHWGVYLVDFFTVRESTSSFAFIYSAQPLGALVAGGLLIWHPFGRLADLIYVAAGLAAGGLVLAARAGRRLAESPRIQVGVGRGQTAEEGSGLGAACPAKPWRSGVGSGPEAPGAADPAAGTGGQASQRGEGRPVERSEPCRPGWLSRFAGPGRSRRDGTGGYPAWRYVLRAPVVRTMAVATAVMVLARSLLQVSGSHVLAEQFETEGRIGEFLGQYKLWTNVVVFAVQALGAARLMRQLSPTRVNLSYSWLTLAAFGALAVLPGTGTLVFGQLVHQELKAILKTPFTALMYGVMSDYARAAARMAVFGIVIPVAGVLSGVLMMGLRGAGLPASALAPIGLAAAVLFVVVTVWQNRAYQGALVEMLREKLGFAAHEAGKTSSLLRIPDARIFEIRKVRGRLDYLLVRGRWGRRLLPDLFSADASVESMSDKALLGRLDELLLLVELYRPGNTPYLRPLLAGALRDGRTDLQHNALEVLSSILPLAVMERTSVLVAEGLRRNAVARLGD